MTVTAIKKLFPGQPGIKKLLVQHRTDLVCVRYRCDTEKNISLKTAELIAEKLPPKRKTSRIPNNQCKHIRTDYGEMEPERTSRILDRNAESEEIVLVV